MGVIIQARMGSKRFPGKVLADIGGKPALQHTIERCKQIQTPHNKTIVVAVPDLPESDPIIELCEKLKVHTFKGEHLNVLDRYYKCCLHHRFDVVIRITGDCPFIDPIVCTEVLTMFFIKNADYASNCYPTRTYPKGLDCEVFTRDCLEAAWFMYYQDAAGCCDWPGDYNQPAAEGGKMITYKLFDEYKEHVTPWMQRTEGINRVLVSQKKDQSKENWCLDYPGDLLRLRRLYAKHTGAKEDGGKEVHKDDSV